MDPQAPQILHAPQVVSMMMEIDQNHLQQQLLLNPPPPYHVMMICWIIVGFVGRSLSSSSSSTTTTTASMRQLPLTLPPLQSFISSIPFMMNLTSLFTMRALSTATTELGIYQSYIFTYDPSKNGQWTSFAITHFDA
jgi:hypothetical protein